MRNLVAPAMLIAGLMLASAAFATTPPASAPVGRTAPAAATNHSKNSACETAWHAQRTHTQTKAVFMAACLRHG